MVMMMLGWDPGGPRVPQNDAPPRAPKSLGHPKAGWGMEECWMGPKG